MSEGQHNGDRARTFAVAARANELMRDYGSSASPRAYEVWYTYVSGTRPLLNDAVKRITTQNGVVSDADVDALYETYIDGRRLLQQTEKANAALIAEAEGIMEMIDLSLGSTERYGASLQAFSHDLDDAALPRHRLREVVASLIANTRDVAANNRTLEARMRESRNEIESLREALETVRLESLTDALTGLSNRKHFEETLVELVDGAPSPAQAVSLIVIDIDYFKRFNDTYGHLTGDQVLRLVAIVMREHVDADATLARFGGEEFGVILPGTSREKARTIAESMRVGVMSRELVKRSTGEVLGKVTISLGIASRQPGDVAVSLLERADTCLYAAKNAGRNRTVDDDEAKTLSRPAVSSDLPHVA